MKWLEELIVNHERDLPAIIDHDGRTYSYGDLAKMVETMANTLIVHGVRPGDRLMLVSENCATYAVTVLAAFKLKIWVSPRKSAGKSGLIGRSMPRAERISFSEGRASRLKKPPGIFPAEYHVSRYSTVRGKKSKPILGSV